MNIKRQGIRNVQFPQSVFEVQTGIQLFFGWGASRGEGRFGAEIPIDGKLTGIIAHWADCRAVFALKEDGDDGGAGGINLSGRVRRCSLLLLLRRGWKRVGNEWWKRWGNIVRPTRDFPRRWECWGNIVGLMRDFPRRWKCWGINTVGLMRGFPGLLPGYLCQFDRRG